MFQKPPLTLLGEARSPSLFCLPHFPSDGPGCSWPQLRDTTLQLCLWGRGSACPHTIQSKAWTVLRRREGREPSLRDAMDSRSKGSFCFKLTLNAVEGPLQVPRIALRSHETAAGQAPFLPTQDSITTRLWWDFLVGYFLWPLVTDTFQLPLIFSNCMFSKPLLQGNVIFRKLISQLWFQNCLLKHSTDAQATPSWW